MTENNDTVSIDDTMAKAYDDHIAGQEATEEKAEQTNEIPANDAPENEASEDVVENPMDEGTESTPEEEPVDPPASWTAEAKEVFAQLPKETQKFISEREAQREKTVNQALAKAAELEKTYSAIGQVTQKWGQYLQQIGHSPESMFDHMATAEYTLRNGSVQEKIGFIHRLAADYDIPLNAQGDQGDVNPIVAQLSDKLRSVESELANLKSGQENWRTQQGMQVIEKFQNEKDEQGNSLYPHCNLLGEYGEMELTMLKLLQSGVAKDLKDAYGKAINIVPSVAEKIKAEEKKKQEQIASEKAKKARTEASVKSRSLPKQMMAKSASFDETLERAYHEAVG